MNKYLSSSWNSVVSMDLENSWASRTLQDALRNSKYDARFQQRQMAEKEERLLKLYENQQQRAFDKVGRGSADSNGSLASIPTGNGKVRQMFDERRQKAGIDRSYPLEPLSKTAPSVPSKPSTRGSNGKTATRSTTRITSKSNSNRINATRNSNVSKTSTTTTSLYQNIDEAEKYLHEHDDLVRIMNQNNISELKDEEMPRFGFEDLGYDEDIFTGKLANVGGKLPSQTISRTPAVKKPAPKPAVRRPAPKQQRPPANQQPRPRPSPSTAPRLANSNTRSESSSSGNSSKEPTPTASPAKSMSRNQIRPPQGGDNMRAPSSARSSARPMNRPQGVERDDLVQCRFCDRRFQSERIQKHEDICSRTMKKKRRPYDSTKHRLAGTDVENFGKKPVKAGRQHTTSVANENVVAKQTTNKKNTMNTSWRQKHEEFIATIRAAKQAQEHVAKGGNLRDLPPPPASSNPDYVQCPHCGRRFNEAAAARHIPKCATYEFNKPKPGRK